MALLCVDSCRGQPLSSVLISTCHFDIVSLRLKPYLSVRPLKLFLVCWLQYLVDPGKTLTGAEVNQLHIHGGSALMEASGVIEAEQRKTRGHVHGHGAVHKWLVPLVETKASDLMMNY